MVKICWTGLLKLNFEIVPKKRIFRFLPWMKLKKFFCQFPNPWTLRVSGMGGYTSKCEKKSKSLHPNGHPCTLRLPFHRQQYARAGCIRFHSQQYGRAWWIPSHHQQYELAVCVHFYRQQYGQWTCRVYPVFKCRNVGLSGTEMNKNADAGTSPVPE